LELAELAQQVEVLELMEQILFSVQLQLLVAVEVAGMVMVVAVLHLTLVVQVVEVLILRQEQLEFPDKEILGVQALKASARQPLMMVVAVVEVLEL
tara:strand:- start:305 stop:592 length:288 start_codon:yes stop_codon:yes gene_type:complete